MNKEEFKKYICDTIDSMDDDEVDKLSLSLTLPSENQNVAEELIKINGEFKKLTKVVQLLSDKDEQNSEEIKSYIYMYRYIKDSKEILDGMSNVNFLNILKFNTQFGAFKEAYRKIDDLFEDMMSDISLEPLAVVGNGFNPDIHEIVETANDKTVENELITEVIQQGFKHRDSLVNYAKVKVNKL